MERPPAIGADVERKGNRELLTGEARYVADVRRDGELHMRVVRSTVAHARIASIDASAAREHPEVVDVLTADDLPDVRIPIRLPMFETEEARRLLQPPLARGVVRYVGEPVAVVVATDAYVAEDAAELVWVEYEELPVVLDLEASARPGTLLLHPEVGGEANVTNTLPLRFGDVDAAFERAAVVVRDRLRVHRHTAIPMETRGLIAEYDDASGRLTLWGAAKVKHFTRQALAGMLGLEPERIRAVENAVGGGFGVRGEPYPEDFLVAFLALRLRRPVKWVEDRAEHFVATNHAREQEHELELAMAQDGTLLAFRGRAWCDQGAYARSQGILPVLLPSLHMPGPYRWEAFAYELTGVLSNRTPVGTYRGPGMTEAAFVRERMIDRAARRLGLDPAAVRWRNLVPAEAMPFSFQSGDPTAPRSPIMYESGDFPGTLEELLAHVDYDALRADHEARRARGETVGIGISSYVEVGSIGPFEHAFVRAGDDGRLVVRVGVASLGQGVETALSQIAADALGVAPERVEIDFNDTDGVPMGFGAFASRSTVLAGNAIMLAARDFRVRAATRLGAAGPDAIELRDGRAHAPDGTSVELTELGDGHGHFEKPHPSFSFGSVLAVATVDRPTGHVKVERLVLAHDVGRAVNPALLRGQLAGAASQGVGAALLEELAYDEHGQPLSTSFVDYLMPTALELPRVEVLIVEKPTPGNPLGMKGAGEAGMVGTPAAIANAVADALGDAGDAIVTLPLTPERVRGLLRAHGDGASRSEREPAHA